MCWITLQKEMSKYIGMRKHSLQLTNIEREAIDKKLKDISSWTMTRHATDRLAEKGIKATYDDIVSTVHNHEIIEYKIDYNDRLNRCQERVVVRSKARTNKNYNLNIVFNITDKKIVTVWLNHIKDRHATLDWSIYNEDMKVFIGA